MANGNGFQGSGTYSPRNDQQSMPQVVDSQWTHLRPSSSPQRTSPQQTEHRFEPKPITQGDCNQVSEPVNIHSGQQTTQPDVPQQAQRWNTSFMQSGASDIGIYGGQNQVFASPRPTQPGGRDGQSPCYTSGSQTAYGALQAFGVVLQDQGQCRADAAARGHQFTGYPSHPHTAGPQAQIQPNIARYLYQVDSQEYATAHHAEKPVNYANSSSGQSVPYGNEIAHELFSYASQSPGHSDEQGFGTMYTRQSFGDTNLLPGPLDQQMCATPFTQLEPPQAMSRPMGIPVADYLPGHRIEKGFDDSHNALGYPSVRGDTDSYNPSEYQEEAGPEQIGNTCARQYRVAYTDTPQIAHASSTSSGYQQPKSLSSNTLFMTQGLDKAHSASGLQPLLLPSGPHLEASALPKDAAPRMERISSEPYIPRSSDQKFDRQPLDRPSDSDDFGNAPHLVPPVKDQSASAPIARPNNCVRAIGVNKFIQCDGNETYRKAFAEGRAAESKAKKEKKRSKVMKRPAPSNNNKSSEPLQKASGLQHATSASKSGKSKEALNSTGKQPRQSPQDLVDSCVKHGLIAPSDKPELANAIGLKELQPVEFGAPQQNEIETPLPPIFHEWVYRLPVSIPAEQRVDFEAYRKAREGLKPGRDIKPDPSRRR